MPSPVAPDKSAVFGVVKKMRAQEKTDKMDIEPNDAALYQLSQMPGWEILKDYVERRIKSLTVLDISEKEDLANIGMRYVMTTLVREELENVISRVENSSKFVAQQQQE